MSFSGILLRIEEGPDGDRSASNQPEVKYKRWRLTVRTRFGEDKNFLTGKLEVIDRARRLIGQPVLVLQGFEAGTVGGFKDLSQGQIVEELKLSGAKQDTASRGWFLQPGGDRYLNATSAYTVLCGGRP